MLKRLKDNLNNSSEIALVVNWTFHEKNKWVSIFSPYFVNAFIKEFNPLIISSQLEYNIHKKRIKHVVSMEPGWAAPKLNYDNKLNHKIAFLLSDPHSKTKWLEKYVKKNNITYILSLFYSPFIYHFPEFPKEKLIHFPWAVPDELISNSDVKYNNSDIIIFGGKKSTAYDVRNWCREQKHIVGFENSGVENKKFSDEDFYKWITVYDAIVAGGSSDPKYDLVTPKYFEVAAVGSLLIGQKCNDLEKLGFNDSNMLIFEKENFNDQVVQYRSNPESYLNIRENGKKLVLENHLISHRINKIKEIFNL